MSPILLRLFNWSSLPLLSISLPRTEQKTLYSPKQAPRTEGKESRNGEESEVLIVGKPQKTKDPSLFWALCRTFGPYFLISCLYKLIQDILVFIGPEILRWEIIVWETWIWKLFELFENTSILQRNAKRNNDPSKSRFYKLRHKAVLTSYKTCLKHRYK